MKKSPRQDNFKRIPKEGSKGASELGNVLSICMYSKLKVRAWGAVVMTWSRSKTCETVKR
jgi:hypothetical protein